MADRRTPAVADRDPWDQQPDEGQKAYQAFRIYLEQGTDNRSIRRVAATLGKSETLISRWASQWSWIERVSAWERHMVALLQDALETEVIEMAKRHAQVAVAFQNKVIERLQHVKPDELTPTQLIQWFEVATRIERQARGMPDISIAAIAPTEDEAVDHDKVVQLSDWLRRLPAEDMVIDVEEVADDAAAT